MPQIGDFSRIARVSVRTLRYYDDLGLWGGTRRRIVTQMAALTLDGLVLIAIGLLSPRYFPLAVAAIFVVGFLESIVLGLGGAIAQALIPPEMQGRVLSLISSLSQGLAPLGLLIAGPFADAFGVRPWWILSAVVVTLMGAVTLCIPSVIHVEETNRSGPDPEGDGRRGLKAEPLPNSVWKKAVDAITGRFFIFRFLRFGESSSFRPLRRPMRLRRTCSARSPAGVRVCRRVEVQR